MTIINEVLTKICEDSELDYMIVSHAVSPGLNHSNQINEDIKIFMDAVNNSFYRRNIDGTTFKSKRDMLCLGFQSSKDFSDFSDYDKSILTAECEGSTITMEGGWDYANRYFRVTITVKSSPSNLFFKSDEWTVVKQDKKSPYELSKSGKIINN